MYNQSKWKHLPKMDFGIKNRRNRNQNKRNRKMQLMKAWRLNILKRSISPWIKVLSFSQMMKMKKKRIQVCKLIKLIFDLYINSQNLINN